MAKTTKKTPKAKFITKPTAVALVAGKNGKPQILVGSKRIAAHKGEVLDKAERFWSQLKHLRVGRSKAGKLSLTTERAAKAAGLEVVQ